MAGDSEPLRPQNGSDMETARRATPSLHAQATPGRRQLVTLAPRPPPTDGGAQLRREAAPKEGDDEAKGG